MKIPWYHRLQSRFIIGIVLLFTTVLGIGTKFILDHEAETVQKRRIEIAEQLGRVLNNTLSAEMVQQTKDGKKTDLVWERVQLLTDKMREATGALRIEVLSREGDVLVGTDFTLEDHTFSQEDDEECAACHLHGTEDFPSIVLKEQEEKSILRTITPIEMRRSCIECHDEKSNFLGMISIDFDYTPILQENNRRRLSLILMVVVTGILLFFAVYFMIRRQILSPLETLIDASRHLARGQYDIRLQVLHNNEIGLLGKAFNHVATEIQKAHEILAMESEKNYQSSITDGLTGFRNKLFGEQALSETVNGSKNSGEPVSILMVDLDHFKRINDTYGHLSGDRVLKEVSQRIRHMLHYSDIPVRYGGEEFMIILPNTDQDGLETVGERLRQRIESTPFSIDEIGTEIPVTASLGGAVCQPDEEPLRMIERADNALYRAKDSGRNRLILAETDSN